MTNENTPKSPNSTPESHPSEGHPAGTSDDRFGDKSGAQPNAPYGRQADAPQKDFFPSKPSFKDELIEDIKQIDRQILKLLGRRGRLSDKAFKSRTKRGPDTSQEMTLWRVWEQDTVKHGGDPKRVRRLFDLIQSLDMQKREADDDGAGFLLTPRREPLTADIPGPPSAFATRLWAVLAAHCAQPMRLERVLVNEGLVELVKALNQAGAALSWEEGDLVSRGETTLCLTDKSIYAGDDPLNFFLLAPLALSEPGRAKFTGGPGLKEMDLRSLDKMLPKFGARLSCMVPKSWGLPARIEASGALPDVIDIAARTPGEAVLGLALTAHSFDNGLTITWADRDDLDTLLAEATQLLRLFSVDATFASGRLRIEPGAPTPPAAEDSVLSLDALLSAPLLAMPLALQLSQRPGGSVRLAGRWPVGTPLADAFTQLLADAGMSLEITDDAVTASVAPALVAIEDGAYGALVPTGLVVSTAALAPVAVALAAGWSICTASNVPVRLGAVDADRVVGPATEFCARLGLQITLSAEDETASLNFAPAAEGRENSAWLAPDADWGLAFSIAALFRPGLGLGNPAVVSSRLPGYWAVYNGLPAPVATFFKYIRPKDTNNDTGEPARRRIKL